MQITRPICIQTGTDAETWEARSNRFRPLIRLPKFAIWRASLGAMNRSPVFLDLLDSLAGDE